MTNERPPAARPDPRALGRFGEDTVCRWLRLRGYRIIERNFTCREGELDIIACRGEQLAFIEVKLRKNDDFGQAREFVTAAKQRRVIAAAERWLARHQTELQPRFDVAEVYAPRGLDTRRPKINYIKDAFSL